MGQIPIAVGYKGQVYKKEVSPDMSLSLAVHQVLEEHDIRFDSRPVVKTATGVIIQDPDTKTVRDVMNETGELNFEVVDDHIVSRNVDNININNLLHFFPDNLKNANPGSKLWPERVNLELVNLNILRSWIRANSKARGLTPWLDFQEKVKRYNGYHYIKHIIYIQGFGYDPLFVLLPKNYPRSFPDAFMPSVYLYYKYFDDFKEIYPQFARHRHIKRINEYGLPILCGAEWFEDIWNLKYNGKLGVAHFIYHYVKPFIDHQLTPILRWMLNEGIIKPLTYWEVINFELEGILK